MFVTFVIPLLLCPFEMRARTIRNVVAGVIGLAALALPFKPAAADSLQDKQREADALAARIEQLQDKAEQLTEDYNQAVLDLQKAQTEVSGAKTRLTQQQSDLSALRSQMSQFALKSYVYADQSTGVATLLDEATLSGQAAGRSGYAALAMGANYDLTDELKAQLEDTNRLEAQLEGKERRQRQLTEAVTKKQAEVDKATASAEAALGQVKGDLVDLVAEAERARAARAVEAQQRAITRQQATAAAAASRSTPTGGGGAAAKAAAPARPTYTAPPPSAGAAGAVAAARSQVGNRYVAYKSSPSEGFDCSGLTMWAWAQAGVSLPHQSRQQFASLPHVPLDQLQPGDLVFMGSPIHHVGLYVGGGMMVDAASSRVGVRLAPIRNVVGAARPG